MFNNVTKWIESISGKKLVCPKELAAQERHARELLNPDSSSVPSLSPSRVRMVVFRDDRGAKMPLFDSQVHCEQEGEGEPATTRSLCDLRSSERLEQSTSSCGYPGTSSAGWGPGRKRPPLTRRPSSDTELLGEMMFGSMPIKVAGSSIKVHYIRSTDQLMVTKVFSFQRRLLTSCSITDFSDSCPLPGEMSSQVLEHSTIPKNHSLYNNLCMTTELPSETKLRSNSLNVPLSRPGSALSTPSRCSRSPSPHSPTNSLGFLALSSVTSSFTRRIQRSRSTSLENASELYRKVLKPLDQQPPRKGRKFAIGVIVCLSELKEQEIRHFQDFFFSHFTLIDAHLEHLKEGVEEACHNRGAFTATVVKAYHSFLEDFLSLYSAPRIQSPVWLSLVSSADRRRAVCMQFLEEFASAIVEMDTKETRFFLSSLLTAVLSHHLAWVFTVSQSNSEAGRLSKTSSSKSLAVLAESHPYNPLWAQLGDLYGAVTTPLRIARTIVTGQSASVVCRLLYLLTYFIRCSEVQPGFLQEVMAATEFHQDLDQDNSKASHDESHDWERELEGSDVFPGHSRASSITVVSEHERLPLTSPVSMGRESPVVKPHPFSFRSSSDCHRNSHGEVDSWEYHLHKSGSGSEGTSLRTLRKSNSLTRSDLSSSQASHSSLKKNSPLLTSARQHIAMAKAGHVTTDPTRLCHANGYLAASVPCPTTWCKGCSTTGDVAVHCDCHYRDTKETCATLATCESMGCCPLYDGYIRFDPSRTYTKALESDPPRNPSCESLSELSASSAVLPSNNQLSRNTSSNSLQFHSSSLGPFHYPKTATSCAHQVCGSIDSGYDQSLTASSLTDSSKESCVTEGFVVVNHPPPDAPIRTKDGTGMSRELTLTPMLNGCHRTLVRESKGDQIATDYAKLLVDDITPQWRPRSGAFSYPDRNSWIPDGYCGGDTLTRDSHTPSEVTPATTCVSGRSRNSSPSEDSSSSDLVPADLKGTVNSDWMGLSHSGSSNFDPTPTASLNYMRMSRFRDTQSVVSKSDSGHWTKSIDRRSDCEADTVSDISQNSDVYEDSQSIDVEQSLSASLLCSQHKQPSLLAEQLMAHDERMKCGAPPSMVDQLQDFTEVDLPSLDEFHLGTSSENLTFDPTPLNKLSAEDFGHSLLVGHSAHYLPDFVLHGTSDPPEVFGDKMTKDLVNVVKHSIIDEPIDHGVAIIADTNTWTCRVVVASNTHNNDVVLGSSTVPHSRYVRQLLSSVRSMWEMRMPPEFCLSHVEDRLLELSEKGASLANTLMEYGSDADLSEVLPRTLEGLSIHSSDISILLALAGLHCTDTDLSARLNHTFIQRTVKKPPS